MTDRLRLGVLVSGRGSNLQAILDRCAEGRLSAQVAVVISNIAEAYALERARKAGVPAVALEPRDFPDREAHDRAIVEALQSHGAELIVLAGYLRILTASIFEAYANRIINIHPSLVPAFCGKNMHGLRVHQAVLDYGAKVSGLTVHFVEPEVDTGPIILQHVVPVSEDDTPESLEQRILSFEHEKYAEAIQLIAEGRVTVEGRRTRILPEESGK
ncbi:MAG: phosphoribosylglycinamide formyltransferase [Armatimonadetes bacterium]|nr:phosphoribosylglycinamide formyltransferase [Armatimonadota bacterium]NIM23121.1 phosphoribosylglycinamide formyltransferase [Armatimonadota bacterium]NIM66989.1 phosphoribosylglycinamide formyltransferase [Armatimonadota bacterium]NIM75523.1 phosphoribosylglycinamide formyltransferase [Armatimonadota bacterium]NIN05178.1 phosphoribosylglycinamide formyltransferase [Armatimonadota bacterium]